LNLKDQDEVEWAIRYLEKKNVFPSTNIRDRDSSFLTYLAIDIEADPDRFAFLLDRMKKAHTSRNQRRDPGVKPVSYLMSTMTKRRLVSLAKGKKEIEVLESLILNAHAFREECQAELKAEKEKLHALYKKKEDALAAAYKDETLLQENERLRQELAKSKAEAKKSDNLYKGAIFRATELEVKYGLDEHVRISLSSEEEDEIKQRYMGKLRHRKTGNFH
jgi:hypothetical protein